MHRIESRAERKVERLLLEDFKRVAGKENLLFQVADASLAHPDGAVREVVYPVVSEETLRALVKKWERTHYGKGGELATNTRDDQETGMLCLHLLQACLVYINPLMVQQVLSAPARMEQMGAAELRALTPLIYSHVTPYGTFSLDMETRLPIADAVVLEASAAEA